MRKREILFILLLLIVSTTGKAQVINPTGIGLRINPDGAGLDAKVYLSPHLSLEGQVNGSGGYYYGAGSDQNYARSFTLVGLVEYNIVFPDPSWRIFIGPGLHIGSWDRFNHRADNLAEPTQGIFGVDGILGIEYMFRRIPFSLSADVKPSWDITVDNAYFPDNVYGFTIKYYFGHKVRMADVEKRSDVPSRDTGVE